MSRKADLWFSLAVVAFFAPFVFCECLRDVYYKANAEHGVLMSMLKFGLLSTLGEVVGLRIRAGVYVRKGFGVLQRVIVWAFLGMCIKFAFVVFGAGVPAFLEYVGLDNARACMAESFCARKLLVAFAISSALNIIFAPVMMTFHTITDTHIRQTGGSIRQFFSPIPFRQIFPAINWDRQWSFVFKKTIPLFWIPAHTVTFLLPDQFQILTAALLGVALGVILAMAAPKEKKQA